jgi:hypothetical protein
LIFSYILIKYVYTVSCIIILHLLFSYIGGKTGKSDRNRLINYNSFTSLLIKRNHFMKKLLLIVVLFVAVSAAKAQEFKPFQLYVGVGYAIPEGGGGVLFGIEPAYRLSDAISVGLRWEVAAMAKVVNDTDGQVSGNGSWTVNGKYYFSNGKFRPYAGVGLGIYTIAAVSVGNNSGEVGGGGKFGFYPRIGFDLGHFNINIDYNIIPSSTLDGFTFDDGSGNTVTSDGIDIKNSYIGIRIGAFIFGGRK